MRLRAQITIEIEAEDFVCAATHQQRVEAVLAAAKGDYPQAQLEFRERRDRPARPAMPTVTRRVRPTGALAAYEDADDAPPPQ